MRGSCSHSGGVHYLSAPVRRLLHQRGQLIPTVTVQATSILFFYYDVKLHFHFNRYFPALQWCSLLFLQSLFALFCGLFHFPFLKSAATNEFYLYPSSIPREYSENDRNDHVADTTSHDSINVHWCHPHRSYPCPFAFTSRLNSEQL